MSVADPGEEFWCNLTAQQEFLDPDAKDALAHKNKEIEDEGDNSSASRTSDLMADGSFGLSFVTPTTEVADNDPHDAAAFDAAEVSFHQKIPLSHVLLISAICYVMDPIGPNPRPPSQAKR